MKKTLLLIVALALTSCASSTKDQGLPHTLDKQKISFIAEGVTTGDQIKEKLGKPEMVVNEDGSISWLYKDHSLRALWLKLDANGVVTDFNYTE